MSSPRPLIPSGAFRGQQLICLYLPDSSLTCFVALLTKHSLDFDSRPFILDLGETTGPRGRPIVINASHQAQLRIEKLKHRLSISLLLATHSRCQSLWSIFPKPPVLRRGVRIYPDVIKKQSRCWVPHIMNQPLSKLLNLPAAQVLPTTQLAYEFYHSNVSDSLPQSSLTISHTA
ncbi:hypothetical protein PM082_021762 [Marasmius tenuissimus]|nr:hypothetical protein PM082_021762 [Marasmius tenuissimus]